MNNENNNDFNAISLGNVDNSNNLSPEPVAPIPLGSQDNSNVVDLNEKGPVMPVEPVAPVTPEEPINLVMETNEAIPAPINTDDIIPDNNTVINPELTPAENGSVDTSAQQSINNNELFTSIPNNNIGTVPPFNNNDALDSVAPVTPVATMPSEEVPANSVEPVAPVEPLPYDIPSTINNYDSVPSFNEIGMVPPIPDTPVAVQNQGKPSKKKGMNKLVFVLIVLLAMTAVGVGVYMFLHISSSKAAPVKVKNVEIEMGSTVSSLITDYATFYGIDYNTCSLDTTDIKDTNKLNAEYPFAVTCADTIYKGTAKIVDKTKPEVTLKKVNAKLNAEIKPEDFIESCEDNSKCSYEFKDELKLKDNLAQAGTYEVPIIVKDESGNEIEVVGSLLVNANAADLYLVCTKGNDNFIEANKLGLVNNEFNKVDTRSYTFKLTNEEYQTLKTESADKNEITYKNITGSAEFNDENTTVVISKFLTYEELNKEAGVELPLQIGSLKEFYKNKGYDCNLEY